MGVAVVDAFEDHGQLEVSQPEVEAHRGQVTTAAVGIPVEHVHVGEEARRRGGICDGVAGIEARHPLVDQQQRHVGEGVAQGGHLPVDHRGHLVVVVDQQVVEAEVAVHHGRRALDGQVGLEQVVQLVGTGKIAAPRGVELFLPPPDLARQEPLGPPEVTEPDFRGVDPVQGGQGVHHPRGDGAGALRPARFELGGKAVRRTLHPLHHIEGSSDDLAVLAQRVRRGHRDVSGVQRGDHPVFTRHVVGGREHVTQWRSPYDPACLTVGDLVGQVRLAARDHPRTKGTVDDTGTGVLEEGTEPGEVQPGNVGVAHRACRYVALVLTHPGHVSPPAPRRSRRHRLACRRPPARW